MLLGHEAFSKPLNLYALSIIACGNNFLEPRKPIPFMVFHRAKAGCFYVGQRVKRAERKTKK